MVPEDRKYMESHEWVKIEGDTAVVGITDHAQEALGDITFIELPEVDIEVSQGTECCVIESVKAANDLYAPVSGTIAEVNGELESSPEIINTSPYEKGWMFKIKGFNAADLDTLMDAGAYQQFLESSE